MDVLRPSVRPHMPLHLFCWDGHFFQLKADFSAPSPVDVQDQSSLTATCWFLTDGGHHDSLQGITATPGGELQLLCRVSG